MNLIEKFNKVKESLDTTQSRNFDQSYEVLINFKTGKTNLKVNAPVILSFKNNLNGAILEDYHPGLTTISSNDKELIEKLKNFDYIFVSSEYISSFKSKTNKKSKIPTHVYVTLEDQDVLKVQQTHSLKGRNCGQMGFGRESMSQDELTSNLEAIENVIIENNWKITSVGFKKTMSHAIY